MCILFPKAAPSLCRRRLWPHSSWWKEICCSAASLPFCPDLHCQGNSLALLFPVLSSDLVETSGKTPQSHRVMGICRCERTAASRPSPDVRGGRKEGSWKPTVAHCVPSSGCCCGRAASQPGSLAAGLTLWDLTRMVPYPHELLHSQQKVFGVWWLLMDLLADRHMNNLFPLDASKSTSFSSST